MSAVLAQPWPALRPVFTVADEPLVHFLIFVMLDDTETRALFDDFEVDRKEAAAILRKHRRDGSYIERRDPRERHYAFGTGRVSHYYIEPRQT